MTWKSTRYLWHWMEPWNIWWDLPLDPLGSAAQLKLHLAGMKGFIWGWEQFATQAQGGGRRDERDPKGRGGEKLFWNGSFVLEMSKLDISPLAKFWHILFERKPETFWREISKETLFFFQWHFSQNWNITLDRLQSAPDPPSKCKWAFRSSYQHIKELQARPFFLLPLQLLPFLSRNVKIEREKWLLVWVFGANALEELLSIPFSEFICWAQERLWLGWCFIFWEPLENSLWGCWRWGGKACQVHTAPLAIPYPRKRRPQQGGKGQAKWQQNIQIAGNGSCFQECPGGGDGGDPSVPVEMGRENGQHHEKVIFPENSWKYCALRQVFPLLTPTVCQRGAVTWKKLKQRLKAQCGGLFWATPSAPEAVTGKVCALWDWNGNSLWILSAHL